MKQVGVGLLSLAGITLLPLYATMASEPPDPAHPDPAWLMPATILWFVAALVGTLLAVRGERR
jgi:O-antigen/teichoic acid export membrane protein